MLTSVLLLAGLLSAADTPVSQHYREVLVDFGGGASFVLVLPAKDVQEYRVPVAKDVQEYGVPVAKDVQEYRVPVAKDVQEYRVPVAPGLRVAVPTLWQAAERQADPAVRIPRRPVRSLGVLR